jgi:hypothetical protein
MAQTPQGTVVNWEELFDVSQIEIKNICFSSALLTISSVKLNCSLAMG